MKRCLPAGFVIFWLVAGGLVLFRAAFDVKTWMAGNTLVIRRDATFDYLLHLPPGYTDFGGKRPLLIFLHGAGEVGKDVTILQTMDPFCYANNKISPQDFPFVAVSPVTPIHGWKPSLVKRFVEELLADRRFRYRIDLTRIYLTGFSMGGFGTFAVAAEYPDFFAAVAPLAGGCDAKQADALLSVPIWAFHGDADGSVPLKCSQEILDALAERNSPDATLTVIPGAGHGICDDVYSRPELYRWFLQHRKKANTKIPLTERTNDETREEKFSTRLYVNRTDGRDHDHRGFNRPVDSSGSGGT